MHLYTTGQWVLLFFFYCFCGWVWESCYVSLRQRRWVNRGFLHGPVLPIYGSGAIIILFVTLPVRQDLRLVFLLGTAAATALEYVTGAVMERLFQMRYWDYSSQPFNLHGYICLTSSIAWGFFSILLVRLIHPPISRLLADVPSLLVDPLALVLTALFAVDVVQSTQAALDLKRVLTKLTEENEDLRRLARRAEVAAAFAADDLRRFRERTEVERLEREEERLSRSRKCWRRTSAAVPPPSSRRCTPFPTRWSGPWITWRNPRTSPAMPWPSAGQSSVGCWSTSGIGRPPSAPARPGLTAALCASCGPTPPPKPGRTFPRPWSLCAS